MINRMVSAYLDVSEINALNNIGDEITIYGFSYKNDYIEEIDNKEDYEEVSNKIKYFNYKEQ